MGINNSLLKSMQTIVDKAIDVAPFDKTRQAQIITNNTDGTYTIRLDGILYNNIPSYPKLNTMAAGSIVKIIIPSNQSSQMYIRPPGLEFSILSDSVPIGAIQSFGGEIAPEGWLICDGSAVSREDYADLFTTIGTTYGNGDGSTTFNLPNLKGRVMVGTGESNAVGHTQHNMGQSGGEETHQLDINEMPSHKHRLAHRTGVVATGTSTMWYFDAGTADVWSDSPSIEDTGGNQSHNNMQPYLVVNYIIKVTQPPMDNVIKTLNLDSLLLDAFRPVGSTYSTTNVHFNPNLVWGGTWEKLPEGYVLLSGSDGTDTGDTYVVGENATTDSGYNEYGENTRKIEDANIAHGHGFTQPKIPNHQHGMGNLWSNGSGSSNAYTMQGSRTLMTRNTTNSGGGGTCTDGAVHNLGIPSARSNFNIMQKSIAVYWWIRIA